MVYAKYQAAATASSILRGIRPAARISGTTSPPIAQETHQEASKLPATLRDLFKGNADPKEVSNTQVAAFWVCVGVLGWIIWTAVTFGRDQAIEHVSVTGVYADIDIPWKMDVSLTLNNQNDLWIKDVEIECDQLAASGTRVARTSKTVYQSFEPLASTDLELQFSLVHSSAANVDCRVIDLELDE